MSGGGILSNLRVIAPLIPWSIAGAVPLAAIGAPTSSVCAACYSVSVATVEFCAGTVGDKNKACWAL